MKSLFPFIVSMFLVASACHADRPTKNMKAADYFSDAQAVTFAEAAARGQTGKLGELLQQGFDLNVRGREGVTPLLWAFVKGSKPGFKFLLEHGANPNLSTEQLDSVMSFAAMHEDSEFLTLVLKHGGDPNRVDPRTATTPIFDSIMTHRINNIRVLIDGGANLNFQDRTGTTPLVRAAQLNQYHIVYTLLKAGADPTIKNNGGATVLFQIKNNNISPKHELYQWRAKVIELLKERGMSVD